LKGKDLLYAYEFLIVFFVFASHTNYYELSFFVWIVSLLLLECCELSRYRTWIDLSGEGCVTREKCMGWQWPS